MGRTSNSGLVHGVPTSPQESMEQMVYGSVAQEIEDSLYQKAMIDSVLLDELERSGAKFDRDAIQFVTKDKTGQIVWLESGNRFAGLDHILHYGNGGRGHAQDFLEKCGVSEQGIPAFLHEVITNGTVVESKVVRRRGREGISRKYSYDGHCLILTGIGTNGFLVSAYPVDK